LSKVNFHYFIEKDFSVARLKRKFTFLEECGYQSILLPFGPRKGDMFTKIVAAHSDNLKLKYMVAVRPYAMHPSYLAMIAESFYEIFGNKLMINIVSRVGNAAAFDQKETVDDVRKTSETFIKKLNKVYEERKFNIYSKPELLVTGSTPEILDIALNNADYSIALLKDYSRHKKQFDVIKNSNVKQMIGMYIVYKDTVEEAKQFYDAMEDALKESAIYGDKNSLIKQIEDFSKDGVTDILMLNYSVFHDRGINSDKFVSEYTREIQNA